MRAAIAIKAEWKIAILDILGNAPTVSSVIPWWGEILGNYNSLRGLTGGFERSFYPADGAKMKEVWFPKAMHPGENRELCKRNR